MSNDFRTQKVWAGAAIQDFGQDGREHPRRHAHADPYGASPAAQPPPNPVDAALVLGVPVDQLGPDILAALAPLLSELERLRWKAEQAERRQSWLEQQADRHCVVPCLTRRAFMREIEAYGGGGGTGTVAVLQVAGVEALRQMHGLAAGEGALRHLCANIIGALRATDVVGCLGGSDFAILLPGALFVQAQAKLAEIAARMGDPPFQWLGQRIPLQPAWGLHELGKGEGAEQAVAAADRARRGLG